MDHLNFCFHTSDGSREAPVDPDLHFVVVVITLGKESAQRIVVELDGHGHVVIEVGGRLTASVGCGSVDAGAAAPGARAGSQVGRVQGVG